MTTEPTNTWPPLIGPNSWDGGGQRQLYGKTVLASCMVLYGDADEFFHPVALGLTGYSYQGVAYQNGAESGQPAASWSTEAKGFSRGGSAEFPTKALVLVTDAGITILDTRGDAYSLWMLFLRGDTFAYTHNPSGEISGCWASHVGYQNGRILVTLTPDVGAENQNPMFLVLDFIHNRIYLEQSQEAVYSVAPLTITQQPQNVLVPSWYTLATLSVVASGGSGALHYQWYTVIGEGADQPVGEDSASYTHTGSSYMDEYYVQVTDDSTTLTSDHATVRLALPPP